MLVTTYELDSGENLQWNTIYCSFWDFWRNSCFSMILVVFIIMNYFKIKNYVRLLQTDLDSYPASGVCATSDW